MVITDLFRHLKLVMVNSIDINFLKSSIDLLIKRTNKVTDDTKEIQTDINSLKDKTKDLKIVEGKIDAQMLPSYVELVQDVFKDIDTNTFYNVIVSTDPVTHETTYSKGDIEVLKVQGVIYNDLNENKVYRVSDLNSLVEITTSNKYYTKDEIDVTKLDKLISGTNIKTINGNSLLGDEDIKTTFVVNVISTSNNNITTYTVDKTTIEIKNAIDSGYDVVCNYGNDKYALLTFDQMTAIFYHTDLEKLLEICIFSNNSVEYRENKLLTKLTLDSSPTSDSTNPITSEGVYTALTGKLDILVSGTNIKTINNTPLTDGGDVRTTIVVTFRRLSPTSVTADKTATEIITAINNGFEVIASDAGTITGTLGGSVMRLSRWDSQPNMAIVLFYNVDGSTKCINTLSILDINNSTNCIYNQYNLLEKLISGTNIKTVNGISLLGSGNINAHDTWPIYIIEEAIPGSNATTFVVDADGGTLANLYSWLDSGKTIIPYVIFLNTNRTYVGWLSETHNDWLLLSVIIPTEGDNDPYTPHNVNIIIFRIIKENGYLIAIPKFNKQLIDIDTYVSGMQYKLEALANVSVSSPELYYYDGTCYDFGITDIVVFDNIFQNSNMYNPSNGRKPIWYFTFVAETPACSVTLPTGTILANGYTWNMLANRKFFVKIVDNVAFVDWADLV